MEEVDLAQYFSVGDLNFEQTFIKIDREDGWIFIKVNTEDTEAEYSTGCTAYHLIKFLSWILKGKNEQVDTLLKEVIKILKKERA